MMAAALKSMVSGQLRRAIAIALTRPPVAKHRRKDRMYDKKRKAVYEKLSGKDVPVGGNGDVIVTFLISQPIFQFWTRFILIWQ